MDEKAPTAHPSADTPPSVSAPNPANPPVPSTPVNYSRPLVSSNYSNNKRPTREEKGKDKEIIEGQEEQRQMENRPQHQQRDDDDGYDEDNEDDDDDEEWEDEEEDENDDNAEEEEEEEESDEEYTELFQVLANIARMKAFDERMNSEEGTGALGGVGGGLGKAGWYHGVRYLGMSEFLERFEEDEGGDEGSSGSRSEEQAGEEEHETGKNEGEEGRYKEKEKGTGDEEEKGKEEEDEKLEQKGKGKKDQEEDYVFVTAPGEETDSDDESWCFIEDSDEEKDRKNEKDKEDSEDNINDSRRDDKGNRIKNNNKNDDQDDHDFDNDEWHDCPHCHSCRRSFIDTTNTIAVHTITQTPTNPEIQPQPEEDEEYEEDEEEEEEEQSPLISPPLDIFQSSPTSFTIQLAIPGFKRRDISIAYDPNADVLTVSGVLYRNVDSGVDPDSSPSSSSSSSSLDSNSESERERETEAGVADGSSHTSGRLLNRASFQGSKSDFEADLELWLAYERKSRSSAVSHSSNSNSKSNSVPSVGNISKRSDDDDGFIITTTETNTSNNQLLSQFQSTSEERIPVGRFSKRVNFITDAPTPGNQQRKRGVDWKRIKAKLEDGILTVIVRLLLRGSQRVRGRKSEE
ncbi:hypothetical protein QBC32DRAFT_264085 [Pseudoneurospora amorphoporcata]|uniref:SHSP domain-containing protein n=1 Tax=Pseudoneurospora amorphoporcata TaxID=241081 RepID=A0AAN6NRD9_9PEZI|nr:hypothetical protein QBC32DRAFT_264085 [Pseudoneurospora amorphoporcata]